MPISATGMVSAGISVARQSRRKSQITATTMTTASASERATSSSAPWMKAASSPVTKRLTPSGRIGWSSATMARMLCEISRVLLCAWRMMPIPSPPSPFERRIEVPDFGPSVTVATSETRVSPSSSISAPNASGVFTVAVVRTTRLWLVASSDPAGLSKATVASASRTSATLSPRLASASWSTSTRKMRSRPP